MVSPLSSRIYNLEAKVKIKNPSQARKSYKLPWQIENRRKRISGYIADRESPSMVVNAEKQLRAKQVQGHAKKRKNEEQHFEAHNVKNDLANARINFVPRSRALPEGSIDMSNVELIMSSNYSPVKRPRTDTTSDNCRSSIDVMSDYLSLIDATKDHYKVNKMNKKNEKVMNKALSTTSASSTTGDSSPSCDSDYFEDDHFFTASTLPGLAEKVNMFKHSNAICDFLSSSKDNFINLHEAFTFCDSARLIIDSKYHTIVHSNASFSRLSGISSDRLVGSSLSKFVGEKLNHMTADILLSEDTNAITNNTNETLAQGLMKTIACKITVFQVPSKLDEKAPQFSHFVLDFEKLAAPSSSTTTAPSTEAETTNTKPIKSTDTEGDDPSLLKNIKTEPIYAIG